jgi:hypothetical protein
LDTEDELANSRAALDDLFFLLDDFKSHGQLKGAKGKASKDR